MKKKIIISVVVLLILSTLFITAYGSMLTMYAPDGATANVFPYEVTEYKAAGWSENERDVIRTMYSSDGSTVEIYLSEVERLVSEGWYENYSDTVRLLYAEDGSEKTVYLAELENSLREGWHLEKSEVQTVVYATDGTAKTIFLAEVENHLANGWYENEEDVKMTLYAANGYEVVIYIADLKEYKAAGWHENKSDVQKTLYNINGEEKTVFLTEVADLLANGWYESTDGLIITMYSQDGKEESVFLGKVEEYRASGWYCDKASVMTTLVKNGERKTVYNSQVQSYLSSGWSRLQSNRANPSKPMVALTFDDGPRPASTGRILNVLEKYNGRATFFVVGNFAANNAKILNRMVNLGCQIGNHTYTHPNLKNLSAQGVMSEINRTAEVIKKAVGFYPTVIRPPYGSYSNIVKDYTEQPLILWSIDTLDWQHRNTTKIVNSILNNVRDGDIILMHDLYDTTAAAVEIVVPALVARGFQLVTVDELAACRSKGMSAHRTYNSFR